MKRCKCERSRNTLWCTLKRYLPTIKLATLWISNIFRHFILEMCKEGPQRLPVNSTHK